MATLAWSGAGEAITDLASSEAAGLLTVTWTTLVESDSRGRSGATSAYGNTPIQDETPTFDHELIFSAIDGAYDFVEVQSGDDGGGGGGGGGLTGGTIRVDSVTNSSVVIVSDAPAS